jgi:hypothetical protein
MGGALSNNKFVKILIRLQSNFERGADVLGLAGASEPSRHTTVELGMASALCTKIIKQYNKQY